MTLPDLVPLSSEAEKVVSSTLREIADIHRNLGALRAEYMEAERQLLSALDKAGEKRDTVLHAFASQLGVDISSGEWVYDPATKAFRKQ